MNKEDKLHKLIHSLDKKEKTYFKKLSKGQNKDLEYVKLFDLIIRMKTYNEKILLKNFNKKNLAFQKHYLYNNILNSLRLLNQDNEFYKVYNNLINVNLLMRKGMFREAEKTINVNLKIAKEKKYIFLVLKLYNLKLQTLKTSSDLTSHRTIAIEIKSEIDKYTLLCSKKLNLGNHVLSFMYLMGENYNPKNTEHIKIVEDFENDEKFREREEFLTLNDEYDRLVLNEITYNRKKDFQNALKYGIQQHEFNKETIHTTNTKFEAELDSLANVLIVSIEASSDLHVDLYLAEIKSLEVKYEITEIEKLNKLKFIYAIYSLYHFARNKDYKKIKSLFIEQWSNIEKINNSEFRHQLYPNAFLYCYLIKFKNNEFDSSLKLQIQHQIEVKEYKKSSTNKYEELFKIISFYEINQFDVASDLIRSLKRKKNEDNSEFLILIPMITKNLINNKEITNKQKEKLESLDNNKFNVFEILLFDWYKKKL